MNQLTGLENIGDTLEGINEEERKTLDRFRELYERERPKVHFSEEHGPEFRIKSSSLPPCGWRPLDDCTLYRFLCADRRKGKFDFEKSLKRVLAALSYRLEKGADDVITDISKLKLDLSKYQRLRIREFIGRDLLGQPVMFERLGEFMASGNATKLTEEEWIEGYVWDLERHFTEFREAAIESGKPIKQFVYFADAQGIVGAIMKGSVWKISPLLKALVNAVEQHYPEIVQHVILFNVPRIASAFYSACKMFLDPMTVRKIELHSGIPLKRMKELIPEEAIPVEYGGKNYYNFPRTASI